MLRKIPHTMSTQHPDNACTPHWCREDVLKGDAEVYEAYFAYSTLGCQEVMWDSEGKDADTRVIRKLLANLGAYFKENVLGRDIFLTYRIPNPRVEIAEQKIVVETLQNVPVGCDVASAFYKQEVAPIFEVILPFTVDGNELICLYNYYRKAVVGVQDIDLTDSVKIKDWIGSFKPSCIELIPLVEDMEGLLKIDKIVEPYIDSVKPTYMRAFIARSDPALNYGLVSAMILSKIALSKLKEIEKNKEIPIYPILGVGSMPFRGHLSPVNLNNFLEEYKGVYTVTIQSGLKYDFPVEDVKNVVDTLNEKLPNGEAYLIKAAEEEILLRILEKFKTKYQMIIEDLAPLISSVVPYIPKRRARKLHIGLFGYSRNVAGITLPRAITFAASLYSLGLPPEFIGLEALNYLTEEEWNVLKRYYVNLQCDLNAVCGYLSWQNFNMLMEMCHVVAKRAGMEEDRLKSGLSKLLADLQAVEEQMGIKLGSINLSQRKYENTVSNFLISYIEQNHEKAKEHLEEAARLRKSLG
ncbi:phosphoenolpyruvate carboxylase [Candidatus Bathyarchaeota archaeon]|nr:phosphoenolpyruvate carboxylase [Candidatus Bathyarchaeota archaeon]